MSKAETTHQEERNRLLDIVGKLKLVISAMVAIFAYLLLNQFYPMPDAATGLPARPWPLFEPTGGALEFRNALGGALISFAAFGAALQILSYKSLNSEVADALRQVFSENVPLIRNFSGARKREFMSNTLEALLGEDIGRSTFDYVKPMLDDGAVFRTGFDYEVVIKNDPPQTLSSELAAQFSAANYRWIREEITYKAMTPAKEGGERYNSGPFTILFVFDKITLERLNADKSYFARFLIELENKEFDWLMALDENSMKEAVGQLLNPRLFEKNEKTGSETPLKPGKDIEIKLEEPEFDPHNRTKPYFSVTMKRPLDAPEGESKLLLRFSHPYRRSATHFIFTMPQPVYAPNLSFDFNNASITDVDFANYLSLARPADAITVPPDEDRRHYKLNVNNAWVFPTSGVTLVWKNDD